MRIVAFHPAMKEVGGAEVLAGEQLRFLSDQGSQVRLVTFEYEPKTWSGRIGDVEICEIGAGWAKDLVVRRKWLKRRRFVRRASPHFRHADVVLAYNYPCSALLPRVSGSCGAVWYSCEPSRSIHLETANPELAARAATSVASEARCLEHFDVERRKVGRLVVEERRADRDSVSRLGSVIAISEYTAETVWRTFGRKVDRVIYPMVRFPRHIARPSGLHGDGLRVLLHSRLWWHKNADTVLRGFALYRARDPLATLDVVGDGPERPFLENVAAMLGLDGGVRFHGFVDARTLESIYARCDVLAFLPMDEPFGMVFPESATRGLLLIGPDHGGPLEILDGGRLGSTVDALSPSALADALCDVASLSDSEVDRRREAADRACRQRYARERVGGELMESLRQLARA